MVLDASKIGELAGIVWRTLESKGKLNLEELQAITSLDLIEVVAGLGWLAREGKVSFSKDNGVTSVQLYQERYY
ncbi:MAG: winged helix-turn-helix domain-containing protein [Prevotella sp.]|nr:winged helix-turn-helix domain-containing protein [Prevotella sp.]